MQLSHARCMHADAQHHLVGTSSLPRAFIPFCCSLSGLESRSNKRRRLNGSLHDSHTRRLQWTLEQGRFHPGTPACLQTRAVAAEIETATEEEGEWEINWPNQHWDDEQVQKTAPVRNKLPAEVRYFDTAQIFAKGGDGGKGCVAFRREKYVPKGGPSGGNGGKGGNVWLEADISLNSLTSFRKQVHYRAVGGGHGGGSNMTGADGPDLTIRVPPGTVVRMKDPLGKGDKALAEVLQDGDRALLMVGGRGGRGNASFKSGRNKAPQLAEVGEEGQESWLNLELKLIADVGIIGVPNAGKSTLLSAISAAKPKIADYPFTTLVPQLGVCEMGYRTTVFADIPGLLEGAHEGRGLGHEFLRHCQRARMLVHVIDGSSPDPLGDFHAIQTELQLFNQELTNKPQVIAYNKMDLPDSAEQWQEVRQHLLDMGFDNVHCISAVSREGLQQLVWQVQACLDSIPPEEEMPRLAVNQTKVARIRSEARMDQFQLDVESHNERHIFHITGEAIERFAQMTNWDYYEAANRFQKVLEAAGINKALRKKGIQEGDTVQLGAFELEWSDNQSESAMYQAWLDDRKAKGKIPQGSARWPYSGN